MVWAVSATRTNHPNSETGRAVFQCAAGRPRSTTFCNVTGLQVRPNLPALPKLFGTSTQAVDPQRSINVLGQAQTSEECGLLHIAIGHKDVEPVRSKISSQMLRTLDHPHGLDIRCVRRFERIVSAQANVFLALGSFGSSTDPVWFFHFSILPNGRASADRDGCHQPGVPGRLVANRTTACCVILSV